MIGKFNNEPLIRAIPSPVNPSRGLIFIYFKNQHTKTKIFCVYVNEKEASVFNSIEFNSLKENF